MEDDFEDILTSTGSTCRNIVSSEGEKAGLSLYTFDPLSVFGGGPQLMAKTSTAGMSVWLEEDPVHLTASAYKDIASLARTRLSWQCRGSQQLGEGGSTASSPARCLGQCLQYSRCRVGFLARKMWEAVLAAAVAAVEALAEVSGGTAVEAAVTATIPTEKGRRVLKC